jgi:uncharacterized alkaline shock family protein YloU
MTEVITKENGAPAHKSSAARPTGQVMAMARREDSAGGLQTDNGATTISDPVVTKVASIAAREVGGVHELGGGAARAMAPRMRMGDQHSQGVSVEVGETEAAVDLKVVIVYGESIPKVAQQIREDVVRRTEGITGLS